MRFDDFGKTVTGERTPNRKAMAIFGVVILLTGLLTGCAFRKETPSCELPIVTETQRLPTETAAQTQPETLPTQPREETEPEPTEETLALLPLEDGKVLILPAPEKPEPEPIIQVVPMGDGAVAALYADGGVLVSGNPELSEKTALWEPVTQLYYDNWYAPVDGPILAGLTEDGRVFTTAVEVPDWTNVKSLHFDIYGMVGVTEDGRVLTCGDWEDPTFLSSLTNVETLVFSDIQDTWACLKKDGNVHLLGDYLDSNEVYYKNVKEILVAGHCFYVIKRDGSVAFDMETTCPGLRGAVKFADYNNWLFGISGDGRLLTVSGGNIYTNTGDMMVDEPGLDYYGEEVDIKQFRNIKDIFSFLGLVLLKEDGTAEHIGAYPGFNLQNWDQIEQFCGDWHNNRLYGIRQDGSVIVVQYDWRDDTQTETDNYRDWKVQELYTGEKGVVGLTLDGKLVGDGSYENTDFSVFGA